MNDTDLRLALIRFQKKHGTSITFIATSCGVSREHLSRWININYYAISEKLQSKLIKIIKGEM
jgi:hypothetical protein